MSIVKCPFNHYYDDKRSSVCPYCEKTENEQLFTDSMNEKNTSYIELPEYEEQKTEAYGEFVSEFEKTISVFVDESKNELTTGWLVCIDGEEKGKSYTVHSGRNFAGRSLEADIPLMDDSSITREHQFSIVYDPRSVEFYVVNEGDCTCLNNEPIKKEQKLCDGDVIQAGKSKYVFVPFCKRGREWV